ncbi:methionine/alanine import family NSS transporter small subunit [Georgenia sp. H159]|jgi:hypothetical protein|uniref:methionine/alanine import family NSS transporter small subunit n=1 Tax=Georgenia sp. H159 TaxID=3076115 RepID=UPI002D7A382E|nr:methionine/alanine import family NSS transporter small subunit [Georgenia sp. H159]
MTTLAIVFMLIAMVIIWGGLTVAITFLVRNPLEDTRPDDVGPDEPLRRPANPR